MRFNHKNTFKMVLIPLGIISQIVLAKSFALIDVKKTINLMKVTISQPENLIQNPTLPCISTINIRPKVQTPPTATLNISISNIKKINMDIYDKDKYGQLDKQYNDFYVVICRTKICHDKLLDEKPETDLEKRVRLKRQALKAPAISLENAFPSNKDSPIEIKFDIDEFLKKPTGHDTKKFQFIIQEDNNRVRLNIKFHGPPYGDLAVYTHADRDKTSKSEDNTNLLGEIADGFGFSTNYDPTDIINLSRPSWGDIKIKGKELDIPISTLYLRD